MLDFYGNFGVKWYHNIEIDKYTVDLKSFTFFHSKFSNVNIKNYSVFIQLDQLLAFVL